MPVSYSIDRKRKRVLSTARGVLTFHDASEHLSQLEGDPDFSPGYGHLWDFTKVTKFALNADDVQRLTGRQVFSASSRRAFVAPGDLAYGLARQLVSYFELSGVPNARAFRDRKEALRWLKTGDAGGRQAELSFSSPA